MNNVIKKSALLVVGIGAAVGFFAVLERNPPPPSKPVEPPPLVAETKKTMKLRPDDSVEAAAWDACNVGRSKCGARSITRWTASAPPRGIS